MPQRDGLAGEKHLAAAGVGTEHTCREQPCSTHRAPAKVRGVPGATRDVTRGARGDGTSEECKKWKIKTSHFLLSIKHLVLFNYFITVFYLIKI